MKVLQAALCSFSYCQFAVRSCVYRLLPSSCRYMGLVTRVRKSWFVADTQRTCADCHLFSNNKSLFTF